MSLMARWHSIQNQIRSLESNYGRLPNSVQLLAISKKQPLDKILALIHVGQLNFGESYLAEALPKISAIDQKNINWHFIGQLQSNKLSTIAEKFDYIHSLTRLKEAKILQAHRPKSKPRLKVCIQVNVEGTENKLGVHPESVAGFLDDLKVFDRLEVHGLMTFPEPHDGFESQCVPFAKLAALQKQLTRQGYDLKTLSMGSSLDYPAAIKEGATVIRLGEILFGPRQR